MPRKDQSGSMRPIDGWVTRQIVPFGCASRSGNPAPLAVSLSLVLLLAACATYQPRPLAVADIDAAFTARSLDDAALRTFIDLHSSARIEGWPHVVWDFRLLTLASFFRHSDLEIARAKLATAEAAVTTAGTRPNPSVGFSPTFDFNPANGVSPWTLGFTLDLPIETAGKRGYRVEQARYRLNAARLEFSAAAWRLRSRVRQGLIELEQAESETTILEQRHRAQVDALTLMEARLRVGEISLTEMRLWRVAMAQVEVELDDARQQATRSRIRLADALSVPVTALDHVSFSYSEVDRLPPPTSAGALRRDALFHRPDVLGALSDYDASEAALHLEIAKQYPDVHLGPGYAWDQGENKFTFGFTLVLPLFDRNRGPIAEAEGRRTESAARLNAAQAQAIGEVELALGDYRGALLKLATTDKLLAQRKEQVKATMLSLAAGATDRLEFLQTQVENNLAERARALAYGGAQVALGKLEDALRRPIETGDDDSVPASLLNPAPNNL